VAKYDYGSSEANTARYGEAKAPAYNLSNIPKNLPLFLSYGALDTLSDVRDVNLLLGILKPNHDADKLTIQYINNYAHMDFIMGVNAKDVVYSQVLSFFKNHTGF
jgi:lysosomal acid lipase/cholesteryl ester hydrolase